LIAFAIRHFATTILRMTQLSPRADCRIALFFAFAITGCHAAPARLDPEYTGCGTDELLQIFDEQEARAIFSDTMAPVVLQPTAGATVAYSPKTIMRWEQTTTSTGQDTGDVDSSCEQWTLGAIRPLHLPPVSGDAYDLQFTVDSRIDHRVITTLQEWAAPDEVWARWRGKSVSVKIYRAVVQTNDVRQGPFVSPQPLVFTVGH
jgi:hypothetical protein